MILATAVNAKHDDDEPPTTTTKQLHHLWCHPRNSSSTIRRRSSSRWYQRLHASARSRGSSRCIPRQAAAMVAAVTLLLLLLLPDGSSNVAWGKQRRQQARPNRTADSGIDSDDYYAVLGVKRNAKTKAIKSAYRKLALKYQYVHIACTATNRSQRNLVDRL
jgi:DnaJ domain